MRPPTHRRCRSSCIPEWLTSIARRSAASLLPWRARRAAQDAVEAIRALIEAISLEPNGDRLNITLKGDLAGMLNAARDTKRSPDTGGLMVQIKMVAGARSRQYRLASTWSPHERRLPF